MDPVGSCEGRHFLVCRKSSLWTQGVPSTLVERDGQWLKVEWSVGQKTYYLRRCPSDSQVWLITEKGDASKKSLCSMVVYVDDFLLQTEEGPVRDGFLAALGKVWTLDKEETLRVGGTLSFLGTEIYMRKNGDSSPPASFHSEFVG